MMIRRALLVPTVMGGAKTYAQKVQALNPIEYWPLTETSGTTAAALVGTNGTYLRDVSTMGTGAGPVAGETAPDFDGTNDAANIYSAALNTAFNRSEGSLSLFGKVSGSGVWTDGALRYYFNITTFGNDVYYIAKSSSNGVLAWLVRLAGTSESVGLSSVSTTAWVHLGMTWSKTADEVKAFYGGTQTGDTQTGLGVASAGNIGSTTALIGAGTNAPTNTWDGYIAHVSIFNYPLTPAQMATLAST